MIYLQVSLLFLLHVSKWLEYYTGMVFRIDVKVNSKQVQLISGGRYDSLISDLGSSKKVNAVGAAINLWAR